MDYIEYRGKKPTAYVADKFGCARITAQIWAQKNGVELVGKTYFWSTEEIDRFGSRPSWGGRNGKKKNQ
jgi:hypothetical protein